MPTLDTGVLFMDLPADLLPISWLTGNGHGDNRPSLMSQGPERGGPSGGPASRADRFLQAALRRRRARLTVHAPLDLTLFAGPRNSGVRPIPSKDERL
jgi:hypothetical protein